MTKNIKYSILLFACTISALASFAQRDTTKKQSIDITSSYKPVLRNAVKINLSATQLVADTAKVKMNYTVPAQNLFYTYQPIPLRPLALQANDSLQLGVRNYLKIGIGNYSTPFLKAGLSFGDGKTSLINVYGDYISSKGKIKYQDYSKLNVKATGSYFTGQNEVYGGVGLSLHDNYLYGYDHGLHSFTKTDLLQRFQDFSLNAGVRNSNTNDLGINYNPSLSVDVFTSQNKLSENNVIVNIPFDKKFDESFSAEISATADITSYKTKNLLLDNITIKNNVFQVTPVLTYTAPMYTIHGGLTPTYSNKKFVLLPNIYGEMRLSEKKFLVQAGFVGKIIKNTYKNLSAINPYILPVTDQLNTRETELYGGIKSTVGKHFNFSAKAGLVHFNDFAFFVNDTLTDEKGFIISNDKNVNALRLHADMSYINQDKFTITGGVTFNGYTDMQNNAAAYGTVPIEITASMRWWAFDKVLLKSDLFVFGGGPYLLKDNVTKNLKGAADLSVGAEFVINKNFSAWADINNLLNNKYERWHRYETYGLNFLGGIIMKF
ncbi:hypothetical protein LK994_08180 [Ferruginibacter lapsinanis]|uniref:hypothetical protein n=1 Tax=Ferruginibacter lapsinanis TaxID=563172 RepID=UPI001E3CBB15|nr:hypothetical protein [Ferruginibacter lapsinanis]UEG48613.1 hypothetical protein LK994_08180 [Ferruginibacter lapsinanis]